jgi:hypothetical protein
MFCATCGSPKPVIGAAPVQVAPVPPSGPPAKPGVSYRPNPAHLAVGVVVLVALIYVAAVLWPGNRSGIVPGSNTSTSCTVGLNGAAVSVTVEGSSAEAACAQMLTTVTDGGTWYRYADGQVATGASICQTAYAGDLWIVRDSGAFTIYGSQICSNLFKLERGEPITLTTQGTTNPFVVATERPTPTGLMTDGLCAIQIIGHNAAVYGNTETVCHDIAAVFPPSDGASWEDRASGLPPNADILICQGTYENAFVQVWDSGGAYYGGNLCRSLGFPMR